MMMNKVLPARVPSPCINLCAMSQATPTTPAFCKGCMRTLEEITAWGLMDETQKLAVWDVIEARRTGAAKPLALPPLAG